jgi:hypothetical protein
MESTQVENLPPPPGVISSIRAGFDKVAAHIVAILLPLLLDLFFWLGPRLRMESLFNSLKADMTSIWRAGGISSADIAQMITWYEKTIPAINLFWLLRTLPIGISSLFFPQNISQTPFGNPTVLEATALNLIGWIFILIFTGWIGGGLYFRSVAWLSTGTENEQPVRAIHAIVQTILLSLLWSLLSLVIGVPLFFLVVILLQFSELLANIAILFLSVVSMWLIVPLFFWPHGVFLKKQNFLTSMLSSVQMARFTLPTSSMFILTIFLLSVGLNYLWNIPPKDSWMTLIGIFGHAFVSTALLAGSFIYYRDMNLWLQNVIERLKSTRLRRA